MMKSLFHRKNKKPARGRAAAWRRGSAAVEFAMIVPVFLIITLGVFEIGRALWVKAMMQYAVEETTRYAMVKESSSLDEATLEAYAQNKLVYESLAEIGGANDITFTAIIVANDSVTVSASYNYQFLFDIGGLLDVAEQATGTAPSFTLSATSTAPLIN